MNTTRMSGRKTRGTDRAAYQALVASFAQRPIHQEKQLTETIARIYELLTKSRRTAAEDDYLVLLSDVVEEWESRHVDIPEVHGVDLVKALLKDRHLWNGFNRFRGSLRETGAATQTYRTAGPLLQGLARRVLPND